MKINQIIEGELGAVVGGALGGMAGSSLGPVGAAVGAHYGAKAGNTVTGTDDEELNEGPYLPDGPGGVRNGVGGTAKYGMGLGDKRNMNAKNPEIQNDLQGFKSWLNGGPKPADINDMLTGVDTYFTNIEVPSDARVATALKQVLTTKQATPQLAQILNPAVDAAIKAPIRNSASGQQDYLHPNQAPQQAPTQTVAVPVPVPGQAQQPQQAAPQPAAAAATPRAAGKKFDTSNATTVTPRPVARPALPMARLREQGVAEAFDLHAKSTSNTNSSPELRGVYLPGAMKHPDWKEPAWSFQEIAQKLGVSTKELNGLVALYPGFPTKAPGIKSKYGSGAYYPRSEVKRWVNATDIRNILKSKKGVEEGKGLNEFAPGGNSSSSYYAVTANFVSEFSQQKEEEIQDLIAAGWTKQDLEQAGTLQGQAADIAHFEQVRDGFLKGLKPGFDAYLQGDTQMKDQLGEYWLDNDLPLNQDWEKIYGEPWGEDMDESVSNRALSEFSIGGDDDGEPKDDPYKYPKPEHYRRSIDFFGKFEANHFDKEDMDDATGVFKGYWYYGNKPKQIAYFKFDNPRRTGSNDPGMGWYYEPQDEDLDEGKTKKPEPPEADYGDDYQDMVARVKKLAGLGPLKTVYDPAKRVYKNVPTAEQPKK